LIPLIIIQCSVIFFFYDRHWDKIVNRFSNIASNNINLIIHTYKNNNLKEAKKIAAKLNINVESISNVKMSFADKSKLEKRIHETIKSRVNKNIEVNFEEHFVSFFYYIDKNIIKIDLPRKYLLSETPTIYILWIISTSLLLSLIALLFLRIQIRAIYRLAKSAEEFGQGKKIVKFKPEGAMEIRAAGNAFIKMRRRINNYIDQKTSFLTGISHDLGTIVTRIKLRLELLENKKETVQIKKDIEVMQVFLKEYLEYSKEISINKFSKIYLYEIIEQVLELSKFKKKEIKINCPKNLSVQTDKNSLFRIIFNLFENAARYGTKIEISAKKNIQFIIIEIEDNGPGIENQYRKKIFKPFYKIDNSRNLNKSGSGLGLSIAKELSKKIKAKISYKISKRLNGSLFSITIPS
jgi:two-component system osmolarity sensor histidine kinase EnvZ